MADDLVFKAYKAQIPPKWQHFSESGSGAKWSRSTAGAKIEQQRQANATDGNTSRGGGLSAAAEAAVGAPDASYNPNSRLGQLVRGTDRTLRDRRDIHYARFLFGPEKAIPLEDILESSDSGGSSDEGGGGGGGRERRAARRRQRQSAAGGSIGNHHRRGGSSVAADRTVISSSNAHRYDSDARQYDPTATASSAGAGPDGGGGGARRKKKTWDEDMRAYIAKERVRRDAKERTKALENILLQRQREAANRRERDVERFAGTANTTATTTTTGGGVGNVSSINGSGGEASPPPPQQQRQNYQSMRATDAKKAEWFRGIVCTAQNIESEALRDRLTDHYEARQNAKDTAARAHYERVLQQSKAADNAKKFNAKRLGMRHGQKMLAANLGAQQARIDFHNRIRAAQKASDERRAAHAERKASLDAERHERSMAQRQRDLDKFHACLAAREAQEASHDEAIRESQAAAAERLLLMNLRREEAAEERFYAEHGGGGSVAEGESRREQRIAALDAIASQRLKKITEKQRRADQSVAVIKKEKEHRTAAHTANETARHLKAQRRLIAQHSERAERGEEIMDKYENIKHYGQRSAPTIPEGAGDEGVGGNNSSSIDGHHNASAAAAALHNLSCIPFATSGGVNNISKRALLLGGDKNNARSANANISNTSSSHSHATSSSLLPNLFNKDADSAVAARLAAHQQRAAEMADDLDAYYVERSEELYERDLAFRAKRAEEQRAREEEGLRREADRAERRAAAEERRAAAEGAVAAKAESKDADATRRLFLNERAERARRQAAAAHNEKSQASLFKVNVEKRQQLMKEIADKRARHAERKAASDEAARAEKEARDAHRLGRVEALKQQIAEAAAEREERFEAIAEEKRQRAEAAEHQREDMQEEMQQRLAARAQRVDAQRAAQHDAEAAAFVKKTAAIADRYETERVFHSKQKRQLQRHWAEKNAAIEESTNAYNASRLKQIKAKNERTISQFINRSATPTASTTNGGDGSSSPARGLPPRAATSMQ